MNEPAAGKPFMGGLGRTPFPFLLLRIWEARSTGRLQLQKPQRRIKIDFCDGRIIFTPETFTPKPFGQKLVALDILNQETLKTKLAEAKGEGIPLIKALIQDGALSPSRLWALMEDYCRERLYPLFDWPDGEFVFTPADRSDQGEAWLQISTLDLILLGVRRMQNSDIITAHLPPEGETILPVSPKSMDKIPFLPHEEYIIRLLKKQAPLSEFYRDSLLGREENQRILFGLLSLGMASVQKMGKSAASQISPSQTELKEHMELLNKKCAYIYKFMSKEIGPVALNVLAKSIDDIRGGLSPLFEGIKLLPDGCFEIQPILKKQMTPSGRDSQRQILRDLNEVLAAEVLAVKKTLGDEMEATLISSLP